LLFGIPQETIWFLPIDDAARYPQFIDTEGIQLSNNCQGENAMIGNLKVMLVATIAAASIAPPVFAQSSDHTGSQMPYYYDSTGKQTWGSWGPSTSQATAANHHVVTRRRGLHAYAMTPRSGRSKIPSAGQR
jgi:hypothetical protein